MKRIIALTFLCLVCFWLRPSASAGCRPICDSLRNTALGMGAFLENISGIDNVAVGESALESNTTGFGNTAVGFASLGGKNGSYNTAVGAGTLAFNEGGILNTAIGYGAMNGANISGSRNIALGNAAGLNIITGNDNIDIGNEGIAADSGTVRLGSAGVQTTVYIAGIRQTGLVKGSALQVGITTDGQLGVRASSARFKDAIKPMDKTSEAILRLKPVTFRYKKELDPEGAPQFGLVAEEVAKVSPDLVVADDQGKPFTVRYEEVNAMLLNEFLKEHKKVEEQGKGMEAQAEEIAELKERLRNQEQRTSAQLQELAARLDANGL